MKHRFERKIGNMTEMLEISLEESWIYIHYTRGSKEVTSFILKNENEDKPQDEYLDDFFAKNKVSKEMEQDVRNYLKNGKSSPQSHMKEFMIFLLNAISLNAILLAAVAVSVLAGYSLGKYADLRYQVYPLFTIAGLFIGMGIGGVAGYYMAKKYLRDPQKTNRDLPVEKEAGIQEQPAIEVNLEMVRQAIRKFAEELPKGVFRTILVQEDNSIDFKQLTHILGGIPNRKFYMSKETYEVFEECDKQVAVEMDIVQKAVDQYVKDLKEYPMLSFDSEHRVNYFQLLHEHYLDSPPETVFYITDLEGLITHKKTIKNERQSGGK